MGCGASSVQAAEHFNRLDKGLELLAERDPEHRLYGLRLLRKVVDQNPVDFVSRRKALEFLIEAARHEVWDEGKYLALEIFVILLKDQRTERNVHSEDVGHPLNSLVAIFLPAAKFSPNDYNAGHNDRLKAAPRKKSLAQVFAGRNGHPDGDKLEISDPCDISQDQWIDIGWAGLFELCPPEGNDKQLEDIFKNKDFFSFLRRSCIEKKAKPLTNALLILTRLFQLPSVTQDIGETFPLFIMELASLDYDEPLARVCFQLCTDRQCREKFMSIETFIDTVRRKTQSTSSSIRVFAAMTLGILGGTTKNKSIVATDHKTLGEIVDIMKNIVSLGLSGSNKEYTLFGMRWHLFQPLVALRYLSTSKINRTSLGTLLSKSGISVDLVHLMNAVLVGCKSSEPKAVEYATSCILQFLLGEEDETKKLFKQNQKYNDQYSYKDFFKFVIDVGRNNHAAVVGETATAVKVAENWASVVKHANSVLFQLQSLEGESAQSAALQNTDSKDGGVRVMISYAWGPSPHRDKQLAEKIEQFLVSNGFIVWRDEFAMKGNIYDGMSKAVNTSDAILVLLSRNYQDSGNCKMELQYATKMKKRVIPLRAEKFFEPIDWLGILIGSDLYYDVWDSKQLTSNLKQMIKKEFPTVGPLSPKAPSRPREFIEDDDDELSVNAAKQNGVSKRDSTHESGAHVTRQNGASKRDSTHESGANVTRPNRNKPKGVSRHPETRATRPIQARDSSTYSAF